MTTKTVFHWGGWSRNYGDLAIAQVMDKSLRKAAGGSLDIQRISSDITLDGIAPVIDDDMVDYINENGSALIVGGGGQVMHRRAHESLSGWQFNISLENLARLEVPLIVMGIGVNEFPYNDFTWRDIVGKHITATYKKAAMFSARDTGSAKWLRKHVGLPYVDIIHDPALFVEPNTLAKDPFKKKDFLIGISWAGDRGGMRFHSRERAHVIARICKTCRNIIKKNGGGKVVYIPHVAPYDLEWAAEFEKRLGKLFVDARDVIPGMFPEHMKNVGRVAGLYKKMDLIIGMRGHSNLIAYGVGTPVIGLGDHSKLQFFADDAGIPIIGNSEMDSEKIITDMLSTKDDGSREKNLSKWKSEYKSWNKEAVKVIGIERKSTPRKKLKRGT